MILPIALALMAGAGYNNYRRGEEADARRAKLDAAADERMQWERDERARMQALRKDVAAAAAPRQVEDGTTYQPEVDDDGNQMPANPTAGTFKANGQRYATMAEASKAAEAANTPMARAGRVSDALMQHGDYGQATQVMAGAKQAELADLQLGEAKTNAVNKAYDEQLAQVRDFQSLEQFVSNSRGDGAGGGVKIKAVPSADGRSVAIHQVNPDGTTTPTPYTFSNDFNGLTQATYLLSKGISQREKVQHLMGVAKTDEERQRWEKTFGLQQAAEERKARHDAATLANDTARVGILRATAEQKAAGSESPETSGSDRKSLSAQLGVPVAEADPWRGMSQKGKEASQRSVRTAADKRIGEIEQAAAEAAAMRQDVARFVELQGDGLAAQGPMMGRTPAISDAAQEMDAITSRITPKMREPGSGATSDFDAQMFRNATVGRTKNPGANKAIAEAVKARADVLQDRAQFMRDYLTVNNHLDGAERQWRAYVEANPIFDRNAKEPKINASRQSYRQFFNGGSPSVSADSRPPLSSFQK